VRLARAVTVCNATSVPGASNQMSGEPLDCSRASALSDLPPAPLLSGAMSERALAMKAARSPMVSFVD
jgi:hypothetical protein